MTKKSSELVKSEPAPKGLRRVTLEQLMTGIMVDPTNMASIIIEASRDENGNIPDMQRNKIEAEVGYAEDWDYEGFPPMQVGPIKPIDELLHPPEKVVEAKFKKTG